MKNSSPPPLFDGHSSVDVDVKHVPLHLITLETLGAGEHRICIMKTKGGATFEDTLVGDVPLRSLDVLQKALSLSRPGHKVTTRRTLTLSKSASSAFAFLVTVRILIPNARSLIDGSGFPRSGKFMNLFGAEEKSNITGPWSPRDFYENVHVPDLHGSIDLPTLKEPQCNLYPFQRRAIRWLLKREGVSWSANEGDGSDAAAHGFARTTDADGRECYMSPLLGIATTDKSLVQDSGQTFRGGILAEEMGLGKTVEMIALMCLHRQDAVNQAGFSSTNPTPRSPATLIITPPAILEQWRDEIQTLAPTLKLMTYDGLRSEGPKNNHAELVQKCLTHDVVLTTYHVLSREIHYAQAPDRNLRHEKRYEQRLSPLTQIHWWRVVLDEAQMVESGVSNAAKVASLIPRQWAWCVSGTPARASRDLLGLLVFLRYEPYCYLPQLWDKLVTQHRDIFQDIFRGISLRHTKAQISNDIQLPPQKRIVITVPFAPIEEQHYSSLFQQMADECGLNVEGGPLQDNWDPEDPQTVERMRSWLVRLRQTCLHPEVGSHNRKALGNGKGPLRTVAEVLEAMIEQNDTATRTEERNLLLSQLRRGQIHEHAEESHLALNIWMTTLEEARIIVRDCRHHLEAEFKKPTTEQVAIDPNEEDPEAAAVARTGPHRQRLRAALEIEHMCTFFVGNAYFQLKTKEESAQNEENKPQQEQNTPSLPLSDRAKDFERNEESFYELAKSLRRELLLEARKKADIFIGKVKNKVQQHSFISIPTITSPKEHGGIQSRPFSDRIEELLSVMQSQSTQLLAWRIKAIELLTLPLVDEEDTDLQGDEYEISTKQQDEVYVYVDVLRALVSDRHDILTGQENLLIKNEMKLALQEAKDGRGHCPPLSMKLLSKRQELKPEKGIGSVRGIITELRELKATLRSSVEKSNARAAAESLIVDSLLQHLHRIFTEHTKVMTRLEKEIELFKDTMNLRLEYYRQLQAISDQVAPFEAEMSDDGRHSVLLSKRRQEDRMIARVAMLKSKGRYLVHLRDEATDADSSRMCIICTSPFETGILTSCGHTYCADCLRLWWGQHRNCPTCKKHLSRNDFHQITYKPQKLTMEEEVTPAEVKNIDSSDNGKTSTIYSGVRESILNQIKNVDLDGSFGTKIDTLARHVLWIREHDPGAKSIVFSQYRDFLGVLGRAFTQFKIGFTGIDRKDGIQKFKNDPSIECFFLHAKAHSSGLNLVNATHVFLCEPLINTAIELQAIARVHRIGQHHETTVWMYLVEGTVEKSIYDISVQRRLAHVGQLTSPDSRITREPEPLQSQIEALDIHKLEQTPLSHLFTKGSSGGELVRNEDLWRCLFSSKLGETQKTSEVAQREIARHLGADAAERGMNQGGDPNV